MLYLSLARRLPLKQLFAMVVLAALVVWGGCRFESGALVPAGHSFRGKYPEGQTAGLPLMLTRFFQHRTLPDPLFSHGLIDVASHNRVGHNAYLLGRTRQFGSWYYLPLAILLKTTIPLHLLVSRGAIRRPHAAALLTVALILAVYPFFAVLAAPLFTRPSRLRVIALVLLAWHVGESFRAHPDYLAYFNQWARGREHRYLAASNLDWGQDLARLARYAHYHHLGPIQLSYFGQADPAAARWLWHLEPRAKIGKSIWLFYLDK